MPRRKSTTSLRSMCLMAVAKNIDYWTKDYVDSFKGQTLLYVIGPFDCLPHTVIHDLFKVLKEKRLIRRPHFDFLIHCAMDKLDLSRSPQHEIAYAISLVGRICKNLKHLDLSFCDKVSHSLLLDVARCVPQITVLNLRSTNCTDAVLSMIGGHCPELRELDVSWCPVTDEGICALCINMDDVEDAAKKRCQKIWALYVNGTNITVEGAVAAIKYLPYLRTFDYQNNCRALERMHKEDFDAEWPAGLVKYQLESLNCDCDSQSLISRDSIEIASVVCPRVNKVSLANANMTDEDFLLLAKFESIQELAVGNGPISLLSFALGISPLLQSIGNNLTSLYLVEIPHVRVSQLGSSCPNLQHLDLLFIAGYGDGGCESVKPFERLFQQLRNLKIVCTEQHDIPPDQLRQILAHCNQLNSIYLQRCQTLTDALVSDVLSSNPMPHLECVELEHCNIITVASVMSLFSLDNPLKSLKMWWCKGITLQDHDFLQDLVRQEKLDMTVEWTGLP